MELQTQNYFNIDALANELKTIIFSKLSSKDKKRVRLVCKEWYHIGSYLLKTGVILSDETFGLVKKSWNRQVESLKVIDFKTTNFILTSSRQDVLPEARFLHLQSGNSKDNVMKILQYYCQYIQKLTLSQLSLACMSSSSITTIIPKVNWDALTQLDFQVSESFLSSGNWKSGSHRNHLSMLGEFLKELTAPNLQSVGIRFMNPHSMHRLGETIFQPLLEKFYVILFEFFWRHRQTLISVDAYLRGRQFLPRVEREDIRSKMVQLQLKTLGLNFDLDNLDIALDICCAANGLEKLTYDKTFSIFHKQADIPEVYRETLKRNAKTLKSMTLHRCIIDVALFSGFTALQYLEIVSWNPCNMGNGPLLPNLKTLSFDVYFIFPASSGPHLVNDMLTWVSQRMPSLEKLNINLNGQFVLTGQDLHIVLQCPKLRKLTLARVDKMSFLKYFSDNNFIVENYSLDSSLDLSRAEYYTFCAMFPNAS